MDGEDDWVPQISCQACGASWPIAGSAHHRYCETRWGIGYRSSRGIAGAHSPLMTASGWTDPRQVVVCTTPANGSNTFRGNLTAILSRWSGVALGEFTLMASFDSETYLRLDELLYGSPGRAGLGDAEYSLTIVKEGPLST